MGRGNWTTEQFCPYFFKPEKKIKIQIIVLLVLKVL